MDRQLLSSTVTIQTRQSEFKSVYLISSLCYYPIDDIADSQLMPQVYQVQILKLSFGCALFFQLQLHNKD